MSAHEKISKFLSLVLRHKPERIGIQLDKQGWIDCTTLIEACNRNSVPLTMAVLEEIVSTCDKQRYAFSDDKSRIRANQGHSIQVELGLKKEVPPHQLFHGTVDKFIDSIRKSGLVKGQRHHVHLSESLDTATKVGSRRGQPIILTINTRAMHTAGHAFYRSENGVWLTDAVHPQFIEFP